MNHPLNHPLDHTKDSTAPLSLKMLVTGFLLCILFTLSAYILVKDQLLTGNTLVFTIVGLGILQLIVQLLFFLHLGTERRPMWNLYTFYFMLMIIGIIVGGSLWIMANLNTNMMLPMKPLQYQE